MNYRYVFNQLGKLWVVLSAVMGTLAIAAWLLDALEHEDVDWGAEESLLISCVVCFAAGGLAWRLTRDCPRFLGRREAMLLVSLSWILGAILAALPFFVWAQVLGAVEGDHPFRSFDNCYFEAMSGLTTTGATVLSDIESLPRELLLWRAFTHWVGGLGIVVLFVAVLPSLGVGGKRLFQLEAPGPQTEGLQPRIRHTAQILWIIYLALTVLEVVALWAGAGMHVYDAVCHTFATLATGGFSTRNASLGAYHEQPLVDAIAIVFMVLAGANFALYYKLWQRRVLAVWRDTELRLYLGMLLAASLIVTAAIVVAGRPIALTDGRPVNATLGEALRQGVVTTASIQTTTGFCTSDFDKWPFLAHVVLIACMFVGGCSGSTAGGIKVIRVWIAMKVMLAQMGRLISPSVSRPVKVSGVVIDPQTQLGTIAYVVGIVLLFAAGWGAIMLFEQANPAGACSSTTAATASVATLCTIGPGLDGVGAVENYGGFSSASKLVMCMLMTLGRLEVFAIVVLFRAGFWRSPWQ